MSPRENVQPPDSIEGIIVQYSIEIINNTRGGIEGKIGEGAVWAGGFNFRMFTHS